MKKTKSMKYFAILILFILFSFFSILPNKAHAVSSVNEAVDVTLKGVDSGLDWAWGGIKDIGSNIKQGAVDNWDAATTHPLDYFGKPWSIDAINSVYKDRAASQPGGDADPEAIFCFRSNPNRTGGSMGIWNELSPPGCLAIGSYMILYLSSWVLWVAAVFFDYTIQYSLAMRNIVKEFTAIQYGWEIFRNFINLFLI
ncbi:MAG: hypothetical protein WCO09_01235 [bacterium]